jgi:hypothetical protein
MNARLLACVVPLASGLMGAPSAWASRGPSSPSFDAGFLASRHEDVNGDTRLKAAGPFFEMGQSTQGLKLLALRPFFSRVEDPVRQNAAEDYLWPLGTYRRLEQEERSRYLIFFSFRHQQTPGGEAQRRRYRFWLLPFYFQGRDGQGVEYRAVFPLGGTLREFVGRDEIRFVLFPLRSTSRLNDLETSNWLWPIISETTGAGVHRRRVFPFYGRSTREGQFDKKFILWPFWTSAQYAFPGGSGGGHVLFPLYGHMKMEDQETWWVLPPFFRFTEGRKLDLVYCPWPFFQKASGEDYEKLYLWPLYGYKRVGDFQRTFWLWPLIWDEQEQRGAELQERFMLAPFFLNERQGLPPGPDGQAVRPRTRHQKLWPLYSYRRIGEDARFRTLELWPFAEVDAVERNWAPLWTLYSRTRHEGNRDTELLWGLYRSQQREDGRRYRSLFPLFETRREIEGGGSWSLLKGLLGGERSGSQRSFRLLYFFTFGDDEESAP